MIPRRSFLASALLLSPALQLAPALGQSNVSKSAPLQGAGAALALLRPSVTPLSPEEIEALKSLEDGEGADSLKQYRAMADFRKSVAQLSPGEQASRWIAYLGEHDDVREWMMTLPGPDAWPLIARTLESRPLPAGKSARTSALVTRLLFSLLLNEPEKEWENLAALHALSPAPTRITPLLFALEDQFATLQNDADRLESTVLRQIAYMADYEKTHPPKPGEEPTSLTLARLTPPLSPERADALIRKALSVVRGPVGSEDPATQRRLAAIAQEMLPTLKTPPWHLVAADPARAIALFEGIERRFPSSKSNPADEMAAQSRSQAAPSYVRALLAAGRLDDALRHTPTEEIAEEAGSSESHGVDEIPASARFAYFRAVLTRHPSWDLWDSLVSAAAEAGKSDEAVRMVQTYARRSEPARSAQAGALLAADQVEPAIALLRSHAARGASSEVRFGASGHLVRIGKALKRPALTAEGIRRYRALAVNAAIDASSLIDWLIESGQFADAEKLVLDRLRAAKKEMSDGGPGLLTEVMAGQMMGSALSGWLQTLVRIYVRAGRKADAARLIDESSAWGVADLRDVIKSAVSGSDEDGSSSANFGVDCADALLSVGRRADAISALQTTILAAPTDDAGYARFVDIEKPADALSFLANVARANPFEERPLIWKAVVLTRQGMIAEAEAAARAAIAVDPSDGDQGVNTRMKAYATLATILDAQKKTADAAFYRNIVAAIRMGEEADALEEAGLYSRAIAGYKTALARFVDAYCVQSRLAIQLAQRGKLSEAATHYRKAFELMPGSFGRMESHCFGCEGVFDGPLAQKIAGEVFERMVKEQPDRPQVHYLLGLLRRAQDREADAVIAFQKATALDPDYVNAWKQLAEAADASGASQLHEQALFAQLRLSGATRILGEVADLAALWNMSGAARPKEMTPKQIPLRAVIERHARLEAQLREALAKAKVKSPQALLDTLRGVQKIAAEQQSPAMAPYIAVLSQQRIRTLLAILSQPEDVSA